MLFQGMQELMATENEYVQKKTQEQHSGSLFEKH